MSRSKQIDMSEMCFAPELRFGNIRLTEAHALPLSEIFVDISASEASITFWGDTPEPWDDVSLASVRMFKLPKGNAELQRLIEFFGAKRKSRARLPEGVAFEQGTLSVREFPESWAHQAFPRSGRDFIHIYQTKRQAVLIRLLGKAGTILDNPLLKAMHENLSIVDNQWITKFPATQRRTATESKTTDTPLTPDVTAEIQEAVARARSALKLGRIRQPLKVAEAIHRTLDEARSRKTNKDAKQLAFDYGALWGEALCTATEWEWCCVRPDAEQEIYAVASPTRSQAVDPIGMIRRILSSRKVANNSLLLFNMIVAGRLPETVDHGYCWLA